MNYWIISFLSFLLHQHYARAIDLSLDGNSSIIYSSSGKFSKTHTQIHLLFRTSEPFGVLLHVRGTTGDFITLEIVRGKLRYATVFCSEEERPGTNDVIMGDDLADNQWHQLDVKRIKQKTTIFIDVTRKVLTAKREQKYLDMNRDVTVASLPLSIKDHRQNNSRNPSLPKISLTCVPFKGCMADLKINNFDIFQATKGRTPKVVVSGKLTSKCADDEMYRAPATLRKSKSYIKIGTARGQYVTTSLEFRTYDHAGVITSYDFPNIGRSYIGLEDGKLVIGGDFHEKNLILSKCLSFADGLWHSLKVNLSLDGLKIQINNDSHQKLPFTAKLKIFPVNSSLLIGIKSMKQSSFVGCVRNIRVNDEMIDIRKKERRYLSLNECYLTDLCLISPCLHHGICKQYKEVLKCDCTNTGYSGNRCQNISHMSRNASETGMIEPSHKPYYKGKKTKNNETMITTLLGNSSRTIGVRKNDRLLITKMIPTKMGNPADIKQGNDSRTRRIERYNITTVKPFVTRMEETHLYKTKTSREMTSMTEYTERPTHAIEGRQSNTATRIYRRTTVIPRNPSTSIPYDPTTHQPNTKIIIIERSNTVTKTGASKHRLMVYLFLFVFFLLFLGLIVLVSVKLRDFNFCSGRLETNNATLGNQDYIELRRLQYQDMTSQTRLKSKSSPSLNDSGIYRSESSTNSNRSSAEVDNNALRRQRRVGTSVEEREMESNAVFLIPQDPSVHIQTNNCMSKQDSIGTRTKANQTVISFNSGNIRGSSKDDVTTHRAKHEQFIISDCSSLDIRSSDRENCCSYPGQIRSAPDSQVC